MTKAAGVLGNVVYVHKCFDVGLWFVMKMGARVDDALMLMRGLHVDDGCFDNDGPLPVTLC